VWVHDREDKRELAKLQRERARPTIQGPVPPPSAKQERRFDLGLVASVLGGVLIVLGGIVAVPGPGPGWLIVFLGLGLVAGEFRPIARFMDWAEVRLRRLARWAAGVWANSSPAVKALIVVAILLCAAALGHGAYRLLFG